MALLRRLLIPPLADVIMQYFGFDPHHYESFSFVQLVHYYYLYEDEDYTKAAKRKEPYSMSQLCAALGFIDKIQQEDVKDGLIFCCAAKSPLPQHALSKLACYVQLQNSVDGICTRRVI